jgi:hypothetical protein
MGALGVVPFMRCGAAIAHGQLSDCGAPRHTRELCRQGTDRASASHDCAPKRHRLACRASWLSEPSRGDVEGPSKVDKLHVA